MQARYFVNLLLFSIWKQKVKKKKSNFKPSFSISKKMNFYFFSWASLTCLYLLKTIFVISFGLEKVPKKYFQEYPPFLRGWGMILVIKTNLINQKNYIKIFTTSILRCLKKNSNICKNISPIFKYLNFNFKLLKILSLIQVLASN